jgi:hypothetical protein
MEVAGRPKLEERIDDVERRLAKVEVNLREILIIAMRLKDNICPSCRSTGVVLLARCVNCGCLLIKIV